MEKSKDRPADPASGSTTKSKLRYPLRSALKSKEGKPPAPEFSSSSSSRRGRVASAVSQSTTALDLSAKDYGSAKPARRFSIPAKAVGNSACKSLSSLTPVSENRAKRSGNGRGMTEKPVSNALRSANRKKVEDLSSATYWLSHIKLSESTGKHSIALGFFKLAHHAGCKPIQQMGDELKLYALRNNLDELADCTRELCQLYNISEGLEDAKISETCSVVPEETTVSMNNDVQSSSSTPENLSMMTPEVPKDDASQSSTVKRTAKANSVKNTPKGMARRSLNAVKVKQSDVSEIQDSDEGTRSSDDEAPNKKEALSKNSSSVRTRKMANTSTANSRKLTETRADRSQKNGERVVNLRSKRNQEEKNEIKKSTKKPASKPEGQGESPEQTNASEENKENSVVPTAEEIQV
ncbi:PREDICTED: protein SDE2 homolog [Tarenaya hassleriana]|uniref:protein SDE2 homolog n=1 Tax=Tarenaya hassleriana TaxID=28532 RepID=UPI00053C7C55|nr:PREDICTED: protein SDE2 homolog [Tarenaya hassleriana]